MPAPGAKWFIGKTRNGGYIYDADTGEMKGLISLSSYTSGLEIDAVRKQFYAPEMYYTRGVHGERSDVVTIYDFDNLSPVGEVEIPKKTAVLGFRRHVGMLSDGRHFLVFNMTPAQSVSVVDVEERSFVGEISTPGCAMIMPVEDNDFLMICGDGTLQGAQQGVFRGARGPGLRQAGADVRRLVADVTFRQGIRRQRGGFEDTRRQSMVAAGRR